MEGEKAHHGHQHQSEEEEVRDAPADVAEAGAQAPLPAQEEVEAVDEDGAGWLDLNLDAMAMDEAMAHALHMEELMQVEDWDWNLLRFEAPRPADVVLAGAEGPAVVHAAPPEQSFHYQFYPVGPPVLDGSAAAAQANANEVAPPAGGSGHQGQGQDVDMQELDNLANNQLAAAPANATDNQRAAPASGGDDRPSAQQERGNASSGGPRAFNQTTRHGHPVGGGEAITIRLGPPSGFTSGSGGTSRSTKRLHQVGRRSADALISARHDVLANAASSVVVAGMEEEHDNSWYESILREAQRMEQMEMEEPGLLFEIPFQTQFPSSKQEPTSTEGLGDPDEPGPSTVRVPPLADDEVPKFDCGICLETLPVLDLFHGMQCEHRFCVECMATYIEGRIHAGEVPIPCPDPACREEEGEDRLVLHPEGCKKSIDFAAFSSWGDRLTESAIPPNRRAYCPNRQCGVMLEASGGKTPAMAFCPVCSHPMCASCGMDWSSDDSGQHDCTEGPSAAMVKKLAEERRWKQCPRCKMLVEKTYGCNVMRCRCHFVFCYNCGRPTGRQTGMEEGAELCGCTNTVHAAQLHAQWLI